MALSFSCLIVPFFIFFVFPNLSCSCPAAPVFPSCGNGSIEVRFPFYTNTTKPECRGHHMVFCDGSTPLIRFHGYERWYVLKTIDYTLRFTIVQDQEFGNYLQIPDCNVDYKFDPPIPLSENLFLPQSVSPNQSFFNCELSGYNSSADIFHEIYNRSLCKDYQLQFSDKLEDEGPDQKDCWDSPSPSFAWTLLFGEDGDDLSLVHAFYSHQQNWTRRCFEHGTRRDSICLCNNRCENGKSKTRRNIAIGVGMGVGVMLVASLVCLSWHKLRQRKQRSASSILLGRTASSEPCFKNDPELGKTGYQTTIFTYEELEEATNGFSASKELGDGGFGTVYKGKLRDGRVVAVKRLYEHNYKRVEQFMNEVEILSRLHHQNLVSLYGCTSRHSRELLLVYEYVPNGTVADHLHGPRAQEGALTWPIRLNIAIETADALGYLHAVEPQIIHRDVKTNNILLDNSFHVKVADFGLSRLFPLDATHVSTAPQGTPGYVDPEYHQCYQLTDKSDVYSFGVVLAELISSKPAVDTNRTRHEINLANMTTSKVQNCQLDQLVDPSLGYQTDWEMKTMITLVAELAFRCLQLEREMRPSIKEVLEVLREIESGQYKTKKVLETDVPVKEDASLLKNTLPYSPDSVTARWESRSTTPNTSG
ncbi:LEAF RUST 10 DISEASE-RESISTANCEUS RECEPTOR-LIKE PROTEIN KINASE-like 1.1 isoform X5 [Elaeis guineensis]|uniref:non-specific serine/threonine protein kinase n=1 Tax=Elaeis guineensis var. tenera TaxID=51953 RepID=A0A6I9QWG2_ELAGV|nr:LEAF RUST 10 DISEASE-RESISTANCE LOCUS RECEPTOR-LIKE PROTEIN KINASE-like 1.1 isoform X6 [Elaeis guineensis]